MLPSSDISSVLDSKLYAFFCGLIPMNRKTNLLHFNVIELTLLTGIIFDPSPYCAPSNITFLNPDSFGHCKKKKLDLIIHCYIYLCACVYIYIYSMGFSYSLWSLPKLINDEETRGASSGINHLQSMVNPPTGEVVYPN